LILKLMPLPPRGVTVMTPTLEFAVVFAAALH
jgi:hypothetical protein